MALRRAPPVLLALFACCVLAARATLAAGSDRGLAWSPAAPTVYVVFCVDTENGRTDWYPLQSGQYDPHPLFDTRYYKPSGAGNGQYIDVIFNPEFRDRNRDSFGGSFKVSWFAEMDQQFDAATYLDESPEHPDLTGEPVGYTGVMDELVRYWGEAIAAWGDEIDWHHHVQAWTGTMWDSNVIFGYTHHYDALNHMLLDRSYFPSVYRAGWVCEDTTINTFLDAWIPFDYSGSQGGWLPYHPNVVDPWSSDAPVLSRSVTRTAAGVRAGDVASAFEQAQSAGVALYSFFCHDRENMPGLLRAAQFALRSAVAAYPGVSFKYCSALEGIQSVLDIRDRTPPALTIRRTAGATCRIESTKPLWQDRPYVAAMYAGPGMKVYERLAAVASGENAWEVEAPATADFGAEPSRIPVVAVTASSENPGYPAVQAADGSERSFWDSSCTLPDGTPGGRLPAWVQLDLGEVRSAGSLYAHFYDHDGRTYSYRVDGSADGSVWQELAPEATIQGRSSCDFGASRAVRYLRVTVTANSANPYAHVIELAVYSPRGPLETLSLVKVGVAASDLFGNVGVGLLGQSSAAASTHAPRAGGLARNVPNPFNPATMLRFSMRGAGQATLAVYDVKGRLVRVVARGSYSAGNHAEVWDGCDAAGHAVPSGTYVVRLAAPGEQDAIRISLVR